MLIILTRVMERLRHEQSVGDLAGWDASTSSCSVGEPKDLSLKPCNHVEGTNDPTEEAEEFTEEPEEPTKGPKETVGELEWREEDMAMLRIKTTTHHDHHNTVNDALGFRPRAVLTLSGLTVVLHRPCDPAGLAATRMMFGVLMMLDVPQERGLGVADHRWGDPDTCRFPLLPHLSPLPLPYMVLLYGLLLTCSAMMLLGWRWRVSCGTFLAVYWYLFLLDKTTWNNHSYLYGLLASILLVSDPHRCWSVDGAGDSSLRNSHVPLWSYALLRTQVFLLYFLAGVKKVDADWLTGYSMHHLSQHWVFTPFRVFLRNDNIDYFIIHLGGFTLDLTLGFLLFFDITRGPAMVFGAAFHLMNSQIFSIGMFPWVCMATLPVFCRPSWPRPILAFFISLLPRRRPATKAEKVTDRETVGSENNENKEIKEVEKSSEMNKIGQEWTKREFDGGNILQTLNKNPSCYYPGEDGCVTRRQKVTSVAVLVYVALQLLLPFSHSITKGYNTWTAGPYGYSWDMMVHSWDILHVKVTAVESHTGEKLYLDPSVWVKNSRWTSHVDQAVQYGGCVRERLRSRGVNISAVYLDVWKSLNGRFQQRVFHPQANILEAPWSPWQETSWVLPVMADLSSWRDRLEELRHGLHHHPATDTIFVADFPGLTLENFLSGDLINVTLEVLQGEVTVLLPCEDDGGDAALAAGNDGGGPYRSDVCSAGHDCICDAGSKADDCDGDGSGDAGDGSGDAGDGTAHRKKREENTKTRNEEKTQASSMEKITSVHGTPPSSTAPRDNRCSVILNAGDKMVLPSGSFHSVTTTSPEPSSYMYTFTNTTLLAMYERALKKASPEMNGNRRTQMGGVIQKENARHYATNDGRRLESQQAPDELQSERVEESRDREDEDGDEPGGKDKDVGQGETAEREASDRKPHPLTMGHDPIGDLPTWQDFTKFVLWKWATFKRSGKLLARACRSIVTGTPMRLK